MTKTKPFNQDFQEVIISLASPESILARSHGEVVSPDTKNHRTYKAEPGGFFCPRIFGPEKDWECSCCKYSGFKYRGTVCDQCGVEILERKVRRERMGHIRLAVPLVHPWFVKNHVIGRLLNIPAKSLGNIIYYALYVVIQPGVKKDEGVAPMDLLTLRDYDKHIESLPKNKLLSDANPDKFIAKTGGDAIKYLLRTLDLKQLALSLREQIKNETSQQRRQEAIKRLKVVEAFRSAHKAGVINKPEWMVIEYLPVMSPDYRPLVLLNNGRFATSDITELLKTLLIRNNRLKQLISVRAPRIMILNEMRMLQGSLGNLFDNSKKVNTNARSRSLKSYADGMVGKGGIFRGTSLGKRTDYSARTVIGTRPDLKLNECGLPKLIAIVLFEPHVIRVLKHRGLVKTYKEGKKVVERKTELVWSILEAVIREHPVLLNRAPTLHKHGIQAFYPKLVEGRAIQLHPLVCAGFNADHDGDMMAVHLPICQEAIAEARMLMLPSQNILNASNGVPIVVPSQGMVLGLYFLTNGQKSTLGNRVKGEGIHFSSTSETVIAFNNNQVSHEAHVKLELARGDVTETIETTVGRIMFNRCLPDAMEYINETIGGGNICEIVRKVYQVATEEQMSKFLDAIKKLGFDWMSRGGLTFGVDDMLTPPSKDALLKEGLEKVEAINNNYQQGLITNVERYNQVIDVWTGIDIAISNELLTITRNHKRGKNSIYMMSASKARGSKDQIKQLCGMRGLMSTTAKKHTTGAISEHPILSSLKDGLSTLEYIIASKGARRGLLATTMKTAEAGYLTRKLVYSAQELVISEGDCNTLSGRNVSIIYQNGQIKVPLGVQVISRIVAQDVIDLNNGSIILERGELITKEVAEKIDKLGLPSLKMRSPIYCEAKEGICIQCYGTNLGRNTLAIEGDVVGNIAAQSISEPGTQLTLRTFKKGGVAYRSLIEDTIKAFDTGKVQITNLKSVEFDSKQLVISRGAELKVINAQTKQETQNHVIPYGATLFVADNQDVVKGKVLFEWNPYKIPILADIDGTAQFKNIEDSITYKEQHNELTGLVERTITDSKDKLEIPQIIIDNGKGNQVSYNIPPKAQLDVEEGDAIKAGQILARIPRPQSTSFDMVGGLPLIAKLLDMQKPANKAVISTITGTVIVGSRQRNHLEVIVKAKEDFSKTYKVPLSSQLLVQEGDYIKVGHPLSDGIIHAEDILEAKGLDAFCNHVIQEIQSIYRSQGVVINDKHFEIILRKMIAKVKVMSCGDTDLVPEDIIDRQDFVDANKKLQGKKVIINPGNTRFQEGDFVPSAALEIENQLMKRDKLRTAEVRDVIPATAKTKAYGITKTVTQGKSFLAAASFQETIKILVKAAISGKKDPLTGIIENNIVGNLGPGGTGWQKFRKLRVHSKEVSESLIAEAT